MSIPMSDREQQQLLALRHARETFRTIYEEAGDAAFWNEGGQGLKAVEEIDAVLAASTQEQTLEAMSTPQLLVLLQVSLGQAYLALDALGTRAQAEEQALDTLLHESLRREEAQKVSHPSTDYPGFRAFLATLRGVLDVVMDLADRGD